jgi:hypothetical protein
MNLIKLGFLKYANECGVPESKALHLWKRAADYPGSEEVFKNLSIPTTSSNAHQSPVDLEVLSKLMEQEKVDAEMQKMKQQLGI